MVIFLQEIIQNDRKLRYTSDRIIMLEQEESSLKKVMEQETRHITTLETVHSTIQKLIDQSNDKTDPLTVDKAAEAFKELQVRSRSLTFIHPCITNIFPSYNQQDATFLDLFVSTDALHVSGSSSAHHQEHKTVHTASGTVNQYCC